MRLLTIVLLSLLIIATAFATDETENCMTDYPFAVQEVTLMDSITVAYIDEGESDQVIVFVHGLASYLPS